MTIGEAAHLGAVPQLDRAGLGEWISEEHVDPQRLRAARERFAASRFRSVVVDDFLRDDVADALTQFLTDDAKRTERCALYRTGPDDPDAYDVVDLGDWLAAEPARRRWRFGLMRGLPIETSPVLPLMAMSLRDELGCRITPQMVTFLRLYVGFSHARFTHLWEQMTGVALGEANLHQVNLMRAGDFIGAHDDWVENRLISVLLYLAPGWAEAYGGSLTFLAPDGSSETIPVRHNRLVLFEVSNVIKHRVDPVTEDAGDRVRIMIGGSVDGPTDTLRA